KPPKKVPLSDGLALTELNGKNGVRVGQAQTDVLLVGGLDGVLRAINPLGEPASPSAKYPVVPNPAAPGGVKNRIRWSEFGLGLPNAQVTAIDYTPPQNINGRDVGDVLVVSTRGRGVYRIDGASKDLATLPFLPVEGDDGNNVITLAQDAANPSLVDV